MIKLEVIRAMPNSQGLCWTSELRKNGNTTKRHTQMLKIVGIRYTSTTLEGARALSPQLSQAPCMWELNDSQHSIFQGDLYVNIAHVLLHIKHYQFLALVFTFALFPKAYYGWEVQRGQTTPVEQASCTDRWAGGKAPGNMEQMSFLWLWDWQTKCLSGPESLPV